MVEVPVLQAVGTAGTYSISAAYHGEAAVQNIVVTPSPGTVWQIHRAPGSAGTAASFSAIPVAGVTAAVTGSIMGDQYISGPTVPGANVNDNGANVAVIDGGRVRFWGGNIGHPTSAPGTLAHNGADLTGLSFASTFTSELAGTSAEAQSTGGVAAGATPSSVHQRYRTGVKGTGTLVVVRVMGINGTVREVRSEDGHSYVRTTDGLYRWANATSGTTVEAKRIVASSSVTALSTYS